MSQPLLKNEKYYTYEDFLSWDTEERIEIIDGVTFAFAAPLIKHQRVSMKLIKHLESFLDGKKCELFHAPTNVKIKVESMKDNVVQPDLFIVCDKTKFTDHAYNGVPELIIEILSPSTASYDCIKKMQLYLKAEVPEYWIVDPETHRIYVFNIENDKYVDIVYEKNNILESNIFSGCTIKLSDIFEEDYMEA